MSRFARLLVLLGLAAAACTSEPVAPPVGSAPVAVRPLASGGVSGPVFVQAAAGAPSIANPVVSFWAKKGQDRSVTMVYRPAAGRTDSATFLFLRVSKDALYARPNGTLFQQGDSVLITATLTDPVHLIVDFQPSGLQFSPKHPAELKLSFADVNPDLDGDGVVTPLDLKLAARLRIWRRELATDPWAAQRSVSDLTLDEVEGPISGFSSYGIAY